MRSLASASQERTQERTQERSQCPRCRRLAHLTARNPLCAPCAARCRAEAAQAQERAYLAAWLSSRADAKGRPFPDSALAVYPSELRAIVSAVREARRLRLDWTQPPAPMHFDARLRATIAAYLGPHAARNKRGRPPQRVQVSEGVAYA